MTLTASNFTGSYRPKRAKSTRVEPMSFSEPMEPVAAATPVKRTETPAPKATIKPASTAAADPLEIDRPFGVADSSDTTEGSMFGQPIYQRKAARKTSGRQGLVMGVAAAALAVAAIGLIIATSGGSDEAVQTAALEPAPILAAPVAPAPLTPVATPTVAAPERLSVAVNQPVVAPARTVVRSTPTRTAVVARRAPAVVAPSAASASADVSAQVAPPVIAEPTPAPAPAEIVVPIIE